MWFQKSIASFNVGRDLSIESINVGPFLQINAGFDDYESEPLQLAIVEILLVFWVGAGNTNELPRCSRPAPSTNLSV